MGKSMHHDLVLAWTAISLGCLALAACVSSARSQTGADPVGIEVIAPLTYKVPPPASGIYISPPPGIASVKGKCSGRLALTPFIPHSTDANGHPYAVVYDCAAQTFEVLKAQSDLVDASDLTLTKRGYYLHLSKITDGIWHGGYYWYDHDGNQVDELKRWEVPKVHDLIVRSADRTYLDYSLNEDSGSCRGAPLELDVISESMEGKVIWKWSTKGRFDLDQEVASSGNALAPSVGFARRSFRWLRNCYTWFARRLVAFKTPALRIWSGRYPLFEFEEDDYIHANSIQWIGPQDDLLVSARNLDTIFMVDKKSGDIKWSLGGKFAKATSNRPVDDPRGGFSHQHEARIFGNKLWVFDNGNRFPDLPSRVAVYQLDSTPLPNRLVFEFLEPNGRQRYALGSVQPLENNQLLIGWGAVNTADRGSVQRAVSIVDLETGKEVFSMDLSPRWISYRVKASQP
jgi:hypothetical protein